MSTMRAAIFDAPLAIRMAEEAHITLVAIARADGFEIFTHPRRIALDAAPENDHGHEHPRIDVA